MSDKECIDGMSPASIEEESPSYRASIISVSSSTDNSLFCRMYSNQYPEINDLVMVTVKQVAEIGAYVNLAEYNNIEGMVLMSELSRRRIRSVQRLVRVGRNEICVVLRVDKEKGYIDLSKRRVTNEEAEKFEEKFSKSKTVHSIMRHVAEKNEMRLEKLYEAIGWPLYDIYGHAYEAFKIALTDPKQIWDSLAKTALIKEFPSHLVSIINNEIVKRDIIADIIRRLTPQKVKIRADVEVACFAYEGIDTVKKALMAAESVSTEDIPIKARLVAPPLYVISTQCMDRLNGINLLQKGIDLLESTIKASGGQMSIKMRPKVVNEIDDKALDALMKKSEKENTEVAGDDEHSD